MRHPLFRLAGVLALVLPLAGFASIEALFAPDAVLLERWTAHDPKSGADIDHGPWDRFLAAYVEADGDGINRVAYGRVGAADAQALDGYIGGLAAVPISRYSRPRQAGLLDQPLQRADGEADPRPLPRGQHPRHLVRLF